MCPQVAKVNQVEAAYWKMSSGYRLDESTHILGFDCGGQQWVLEVRPHKGEEDEDALDEGWDEELELTRLRALYLFTLICVDACVVGWTGGLPDRAAGRPQAQRRYHRLEPQITSRMPLLSDMM
jgi:hypothetical protein